MKARFSSSHDRSYVKLADRFASRRYSLKKKLRDRMIKQLLMVICQCLTDQDILLNLIRPIIGPFTVMDGSEADGDLVLVQTFLLYYVNQVILMLTSIFQGQFP